MFGGNTMRLAGSLISLLLITAFASVAADETAPARDPKQPVNEAYTAKIKKYTTAPVFTSPLVDYLPASKNVPTPETVRALPASSPTPQMSTNTCASSRRPPRA